MDTVDFMDKHRLTDEDLNRMTKPYERGDYAHEDGAIRIGSHLDGVNRPNDPKEHVR